MSDPRFVVFRRHVIAFVSSFVCACGVTPATPSADGGAAPPAPQADVGDASTTTSPAPPPSVASPTPSPETNPTATSTPPPPPEPPPPQPPIVPPPEPKPTSTPPPPPPPPAPECQRDADCNDAKLCTLDRCVANKCQRTAFSDSPALSTPLVPSAEIVLGPGARVIETHFDGTDFLVVWRDGSGNVLGRRVSPSGQVVDSVSWSLPSDLVSVAFDGTKYMGLRNVFDSVTSTIVPHVGFIQRTGNVGNFWPLDLYCRNSNTLCAGHQVVYGGGNFLVLYAPASWRDVNYMLFDTGGNLVQHVELLRNMGQYPRAAYDGSRFAIVWDDFRDISNAASIYAAHAKPGGGNFSFANHVPLVTESPPSDLNASGVPTITAGSSSYLVTFYGFRDPHQVRRTTKTWGLDPVKITGVGDQFDVNNRPSVFDGRNFVVSSSTCGASLACSANSTVYASRITEQGALVDPQPVALAPVGSTYPKLASSRTGKNLVAYERAGATIARLFDTCP